MQLPGFPQYWYSGGSNNLALNDAGTFAFVREIYNFSYHAGMGVFTNRSGNDAALYTYLTEVPGGVPADSFFYFDWIRLNKKGHIAFYAGTIQEGGTNGKFGFWAERDGSPQLVTYLNVQAPGTPAGPSPASRLFTFPPTT